MFDRFRPQRTALAVTAAATIIEPDDDVEAQRVRRGARDWQRESWRNYDDVPEIAYAANYQSGALGRLRLVPAYREDPRDLPIPLDPDGDDDFPGTPDERAAAFATLDRLGQGDHPLGEIQRLLALNLFVAGEGYLVGYESEITGGEVWDVVSVEELVQNQNQTGWARRVDDSGPAAVEQLPPDAFVCRIFQRHPLRSAQAYSTMRSVLELCTELKLLTDGIHAAAQSRLAAKILLLTHGFRGGPLDATMVGQEGEAQQDPVIQQIQRHFESPIKNPRSASRVSPLLLFADREDVAAAKLLDPMKDIDVEAAKQRAEIIVRIATGVDLPSDVLTGKADLNHWTAWQVDEETWKYHLEPDARIMVNALTTGYFRPHLAAMGVADLQNLFVWYDPQDLIAHPNAPQDYSDGYDRMEVSGGAWRKAHNIPEDDAPDEEERAQRIWVKMAESARTQPVAMPTVAEIEAGEIENVEAPGEEPVAPGAPTPVSTPTEGPPKSGRPSASNPVPAAAVVAAVLPSTASLAARAPIGPLGPRFARMERDLRLRIVQEADGLLRRALEKAGNSLRSKAGKGDARATPGLADLRQTLAGLDPLDVAAHLGRDRVAALGSSEDDLLAGAFAGLGTRWDSWVARAQQQALAGIDDHGDLGDSDTAQADGRFARAREDGWGVLEAGLVALAAVQLYDPHAPPPGRGEFSDSRVSTGLVRDALVTAGGGPVEGGTSTGLFSGQIVEELLPAAGLAVSGYVWLHGDPMIDFVPHLDLDGYEFASDPFGDPSAEDDSALAVTEEGAWLDVDYYWPGDHDGCTCDIVQVIETAESAPMNVDATSIV